MSQGRTVVEPLRRATKIIVEVGSDLTIALGAEPQVRAESDKPIGVARNLLGTRLTAAHNLPNSHHGVVASGAGSVAVGGNSTTAISTRVDGRNVQHDVEPATSTRREHGTTITVPEGVEVVVKAARSLTVDPSARTAIQITDNR